MQDANWTSSLDLDLPIVQLLDMENRNIIIEIEEYAKAAGLSTSTVCVRATGNSRLFARLNRRFNQTDADTKRLRQFMDANPVEKKEGAAQ